VAVKYAVAMGMRVVTVVAPNDKVFKKIILNKKTSKFCC
jgi:hypothetical protein